jgi:glycosyltransferase involved in cell wall biosynthesis
MDRLRVGVLMEDCLPTEGGGYSYYQMLLMAIDKYTFHPEIEIIHVDFFNRDNELPPLSKQVIKIKRTVFGTISYLFLNFFYKVIHWLFKKGSKNILELLARLMDAINNRAARNTLTKENFHIVYYLKPRDNLIDFPMIVTHWDVGHKSMYPFPEVGWNGNFEKRESYYSTMLNKAFLILCESESGARELQHYYPVNPARIRVMPLFAGNVVFTQVSDKDQLQILADYELLKGGFYLYTAQFWSHKNHSTLIRAFKSVLEQPKNASLKLVLCGGDKGNLHYIKKLIAELKLEKSVVIPGFISNTHLYTLYKNAIALVMPTFLGPTNIPLIEAAQLHCTILCSDLAGHREILGENALYFNPSSAAEMQHCMEQVLKCEIREELASSAYRYIRNSSFQVDKSILLLDRFLQELKPIRAAWGMA